MQDYTHTSLNTPWAAADEHLRPSLAQSRQLVDEALRDNLRTLEQATARMMKMFQARDPLSSWQLSSAHTSALSGECMAMAFRNFEALSRMQSEMLSALQRFTAGQPDFLSAAYKGLPAAMGKPLSGGDSQDWMLSSMQAAFEMGQQAMQSAQSAARQSSELAHQSLNALLNHQAPSPSPKNRKK